MGGLGVLFSRNASFQSFLVDQYLKKLSQELDARISVEKISVSLFNGVALHDLYIADLHDDTLLYVGEFDAKIDHFSLSNQILLLDKVTMDKAYFNLKKYENEQKPNFSFLIDHFLKNDTLKKPWSVHCEMLQIKASRFKYDNLEHVEKDKGIDYQHIYIDNLSTNISAIELLPKGVRCDVLALNFVEQSGFHLEEFKTRLMVTPQGITTNDLVMRTAASHVIGDITFESRAYSDFSRFVDDITIKSTFDRSLLDFDDLFFFAPALEGLGKSLYLSGNVNGKISDLHGEDIAFHVDDGTLFKGDASIKGLPDVEKMWMNVNVDRLVTNKRRIEQIPLYPFTGGKRIKLPPYFQKLGEVSFKGLFKGYYHDFFVKGDFLTSLGDLDTDVRLQVAGKEKYQGKISTNHFELGTFFGVQKLMSSIAMDLEVDGVGFSKEHLNASTKGNIRSIVVKEYEYNNVLINGSFSDQLFSGLLQVDDENISFDFDGTIDLRDTLPKYNFTSSIKNAKLAKLNLIKTKSKLKTRLDADLTVNLVGDGLENMIGSIEFLDIHYRDKLDVIRVGNIKIESAKSGLGKKLSIDSEVMNMELEGEYYLAELIKAGYNNLSNYIPSIKSTTETSSLNHDFTFKTEVHNSKLLSKIVLNGVELSPHTSASGFYNSYDNSISLYATSPYIKGNGVVSDNVLFNLKTIGSKLYINVGSDKITYNNRFSVDHVNLSTILTKDTLWNDLNWASSASQRTEGHLALTTAFRGLDQSITKFNDSYFYLRDTLWDIASDHSITVDSTGVRVQNGKIFSGSQSVMVDGFLPNFGDDQLDITLKKFDLIHLKNIIPSNYAELEGRVNGVISLKKAPSGMFFVSNIDFEQFAMNKIPFGRGTIISEWNAHKKMLDVYGGFNSEQLSSISFSGNYKPYNEDNSLDLTFGLKQTNMEFFAPYTEAFMSDLQGEVDANIQLKGTIAQPEMEGYVLLRSASFLVNYLQTTYTTPRCHIKIIPDMISFDNVTFLDQNANKALANGTFFHDGFRDWDLDIGLSVNNFMAMNTTQEHNDLYFGKGHVTGMVDIEINPNLMYLDADVKTEKNTVFNIPISEEEEIMENNFIEFVSKDTVELENKEFDEEVDLSKIQMNFNLEVTPEAEVRLIFDDKVGDIMKSTGNGNLNFSVDDHGNFEMFGNYQIKDGSYLFTLQNVINKRFDLDEGGTISWDGDPYEAKLDLTAIYRLRARLYELLVGSDDSTSLEAYKKRTPVDLKLNMTGNMLSPDVSFDIELPTADEDTRDRVRSILYVNDSEENIQELNKQVFSLLVLNQFVQSTGAAGPSPYANVGATTSSELLSNQLSNWLSKISNDFDIGINYQPGDELSNREIELALSTQMFNDRLILDGNLGFSDRENISTTAETNNLIGDFSLEYKITEDGKMRVKAFNISNEYALGRVNSPYTQGVGLFYREEYDTTKEFFNNFFNTFKRKHKKD